MKKVILFVILSAIVVLSVIGCDPAPQSSDEVQKDQQETMLLEATKAVGMPAIKNFRERRIMKDIQELCDQDGLVTYSYMENGISKIVPGKTALAGKLTYMGQTVGYPIPYSTQYTNPEKVEYHGSSYGWVTLPQADPNGLFKPTSAEGTWVLMKDPHGSEVKPVYCEPKIIAYPFKLPFD